MTFDTLAAGQADRPAASPNGRTPALDLDSVYGGGPVARPAVRPRPTGRSCGSRPAGCSRTCRGWRTARRSSATRATTRTSSSPGCTRLHPVPQQRPSTGCGRGATTSDSRGVRRGPPADDAGTTSGSILHEFLPLFVGQPMVDDDPARAGRRFYRPRTGRRSCRSSSRARATGSATAWCGRPTAPTSPGDGGTAVLRDDLRPGGRTGQPTPPTCAVAAARRGGSSAGRRSSTSATGR